MLDKIRASKDISRALSKNKEILWGTDGIQQDKSAISKQLLG